MGGDGCFKISSFGSCFTCENELLSNEQIPEFEKDLMDYSKLELIPPEIKDLKNGGIVTPKIDIWQLGYLLKRLINIASPEKVNEYSSQLFKLNQMMLMENPRERPTAIDVIQFIMCKESMIASGPLPSGDGDFPNPQAYLTYSQIIPQQGEYLHL